MEILLAMVPKKVSFLVMVTEGKGALTWLSKNCSQWFYC
jgi:hypothetical protein